MFISPLREDWFGGIILLALFYFFIFLIFRFFKFSPTYNKENLHKIAAQSIAICFLYIYSSWYRGICLILWGICVLFLIIQLFLMYKSKLFRMIVTKSKRNNESWNKLISKIDVIAVCIGIIILIINVWATEQGSIQTRINVIILWLIVFIVFVKKFK